MDFYRKRDQAIIDFAVATIDIKEAHIYASTPDLDKKPDIRVFRFQSNEDREFGRRFSDDYFYSDMGACYMAWKDQKEEDLLTVLREMVIELSSRGIPVNNVIREFAKISQFAAQGADSFPMARALSVALVGEAYDDTDYWRQFVTTTRSSKRPVVS
jgi:hypothetical protein